MTKKTAKKTAKKLTLNKKTVSVLTDRSIIANLNHTNRPVIIISMGCGTDFTRNLPTNLQKFMTDFTKPVK